MSSTMTKRQRRERRAASKSSDGCPFHWPNIPEASSSSRWSFPPIQITWYGGSYLIDCHTMDWLRHARALTPALPLCSDHGMTIFILLAAGKGRHRFGLPS
jgi:hypothetical protein